MLGKEQEKDKEQGKTAQHDSQLDAGGPVKAPGVGHVSVGNPAGDNDKPFIPHSNVDDNRYAAYQSPALTTVSQHQGLVGRLAVEFLISLIEKPDEHAYQRVLKPELVIRESAGPVRS